MCIFSILHKMTTHNMPKSSCTINQDDGSPVVASSATVASLLTQDDGAPVVASSVVASSGTVASLHDGDVYIIYQGDCVYITRQIRQVIVHITAKISELEGTTTVKALKPCKVKVQSDITVLYEKAQGLWVKAYGNFAVEKGHRSINTLHKAIVDSVNLVIPKVSQLNKSAKPHMRFTASFEPGAAYANDSFACVSGKVGPVVVSVRAKGDFAKKRVLTAYAGTLEHGDKLVRPVLDTLAERCGVAKGNVTEVFQPYWIKIEGEFLILKCNVGDTFVDIKAKLCDVLGDVTGTLEPYCTTIRKNCSDFVTKAESQASKVIEYAQTAKTVKTNALHLASEKNTKIRIYMSSAAAKASELKTSAVTQASEVSASDAVKSAAVLGTSAGAAGFVAGGAVGAAMGVVPAVFTFGLSVPIGAAIGSGAGMCMGAAAGGATGLVGGKFAGKHKDDIEKHMNAALVMATACKDFVKEKLPENTATKLQSCLDRVQSATAIGGTAQ